ncbi:hypothetical protein GCM10009624_22550 [Gordonia sinesedis]
MYNQLTHHRSPARPANLPPTRPSRTRRRSLATVSAVLAAMAAATVTGVGTAAAAGTGVEISGRSNGDCTATITLTNYTNTRFYQPDWWFEQENDPAMVTATTLPPEMPPPWRAVNGIPWPMARWVGSPALSSGVADGVPVWPGSPYRSDAQPDGFVTSATIDLATAADAPAPSANRTKTIYFRVRSGPVTADRRPTPIQLVVTGCKVGGGSSDWGSSGSSDWGSSGSSDWGSSGGSAIG